MAAAIYHAPRGRVAAGRAHHRPRRGTERVRQEAHLCDGRAAGRRRASVGERRDAGARTRELPATRRVVHTGAGREHRVRRRADRCLDAPGRGDRWLAVDLPGQMAGGGHKMCRPAPIRRRAARKRTVGKAEFDPSATSSAQNSSPESCRALKPLGLPEIRPNEAASPIALGLGYDARRLVGLLAQIRRRVPPSRALLPPAEPLFFVSLGFLISALSGAIEHASRPDSHSFALVSE